MNFKKILVISLALIMVASSLSIVSAGLFDFGSNDDSKETLDIELGKIIDSDVNAVMEVESGSAVVTSNGLDTSSADVSYNINYTAQVDISNLNDSSKKLLEEAIKEESTVLDVSLDNSENDERTSCMGLFTDVDYKIDGDVLYIEGKSLNQHNVGETFEGEVKVGHVEIQKWTYEDNSADGSLEATFHTNYNTDSDDSDN